MNYAEQHKADLQAAREEQQRANDSQALYFFFAKHREICPVEANRRLILSHFNGDPLNERSLEEALEHPTLKNGLAYQSPAQDREELQEAIIKLLEPAASENAITGMRANFKFKTNQELAEMKSELERKREMRSRSTQELRDIVRRPAREFPPLSEFHKNRTFLLACATENLEEFRRLIRVHGLDQINAVLAQPSRKD